MRAGAAPVTFAETRRRLHSDRVRLGECLARSGAPAGCLRCTPAYASVAMHRYSHWLFARGWRIASRLLWQLNLWITGVDIAPMSDLGEGLVILHPCAVTIAGRAGRNLLVEGQGGMGGGMTLEDVGAGPGVPVLGDDVRLERGAMVLGPVRVGDRVHIGPGCTVVHDVPSDSIVDFERVRVRTGSPA